MHFHPVMCRWLSIGFMAAYWNWKDDVSRFVKGQCPVILQDLRAGVLAAGRHHNSSTQSTILLYTSFQLLGEGRQALSSSGGASSGRLDASRLWLWRIQAVCPHGRKPCPGKIAEHFVAGSARNSLQLANELDIDRKTIDNHIEILTRYGLVEEKMVEGTAKHYIVTEHGRKVLSLLERSTVPNWLYDQNILIGFTKSWLTCARVV